MVGGDYSAKEDRQLSLILIEESYINKESEKQLRSRYDQFISSVPICCCGIESVRSKVVSFESLFDRNQRSVHRAKVTA